MPNFGLLLLLNWRLLQKTSYLKIKGQWGMVIYNLQKRSWKGCKNRATRRQTGLLPNIQPSRGTTAATRPFLGKEKGDTDAAVIMQTYFISATNRKPTVL